MLSVIGDFHIPERAQRIPKWELDLLSKSELIACTGDFTDPSVYSTLKTLAPVKAVRGNMDTLSLPETITFEFKGKKFGLFHGTGIVPRGDWDQLLSVARSLNVNILLTGHTHHWALYEYRGVIFINPGSATGVWGGSSDGGPESMATVDIDSIHGKIRVNIWNDGKIIKSQEF